MMSAMSTTPLRSLAVIGRSTTGQPRTYPVETVADQVSRAAAYRRLAATVMGVDVATLALELRAKRLGGLQPQIHRLAA
jgi:hypothetical protein